MRWWRALCFVWPLLFVGPASALAQDAARSCRFICEMEWKFEPTFVIENLAHRHRVVGPDGVIDRVNRERVFETVLALDLKTKRPRFGFTAELSAAPFSFSDGSCFLDDASHWSFSFVIVIPIAPF